MGKTKETLFYQEKGCIILLCVALTPAKMDHKYFINTNYLKRKA